MAKLGLIDVLFFYQQHYSFSAQVSWCHPQPQRAAVKKQRGK
jgi:hypothetical protein